MCVCVCVCVCVNPIVRKYTLQKRIGGAILCLISLRIMTYGQPYVERKREREPGGGKTQEQRKKEGEKEMDTV